MQIKINSRLGSVGLVIKAMLRESKVKEAAELAGRHILFHQVGSKAFNEKSGFKRDAVFSPELAAHVKATALKLFGELFEDISIETAAYVRATPYDRFVKEMKAIGFEETAIAEMWAKRPVEAKEAAATPTLPVEESDEEVVG